MTLGTVIRSFASPVGTRGIDWDGRSLWIGNDGANLLQQIDPISGTLIRSLPTPATNIGPVCFDGRTLWHGDWATILIYQLGIDSGVIIRSFAAIGEPQDLAWDGKHLWLAAAQFSLRKFDPITGTIVSTVPLAFGIHGVTWDGKNLWVSSIGTDRIYQVDPRNGTVITSFPSLVNFAIGLAWDGRTLWSVDFLGTIRQFSVN